MRTLPTQGRPYEEGRPPKVYFFAGSMIFHTSAASAPPTNGPTMKIQRLAKAEPPWNRAGPMERAGFTDVPV